MFHFMINHPRLLSAVLLCVMAALSFAGTKLRFLHPKEDDGKNEDITLVISATLTLLGLIIGFMFSMATSRYDQRRLYEEGEANAIGTEWVRCDLMPASEAAATRGLLRQYVQSRIDFYNSDEGNKLGVIDRQSSQLQTQLWKSIQPIAATQPTPVTALVVSGMNDVLNSQGYTQFSWWNRIPTTAWVLLVTIACVSNLLVGYGTGRRRARSGLLIVLPVLVAVAIFLVADIDSPRGGVIRVHPRDLVTLQQTLH
ncbi:hypothetical protein GCM10022270_09510 [Terriglobus aquaticus]